MFKLSNYLAAHESIFSSVMHSMLQRRSLAARPWCRSVDPDLWPDVRQRAWELFAELLAAAPLFGTYRAVDIVAANDPLHIYPIDLQEQVSK